LGLFEGIKGGGGAEGDAAARVALILMAGGVGI